MGLLYQMYNIHAHAHIYSSCTNIIPVKFYFMNFWYPKFTEEQKKSKLLLFEQFENWTQCDPEILYDLRKEESEEL